MRSTLRTAIWTLIVLMVLTTGYAAAQQETVISVSTGAGDPFWEQIEMQYEEIRPNVDIELNQLLPAPEGYRQLSVQFVSGNTWDIVITSEAYIMAVAGDYGQFDLPYLVDLTPYLTEQDREDFGEQVLSNTTYIGKYQGLPFGANPGWAIIVANKELLAEAGIDYTQIQKNGWTWDEFSAAARKLTKPENDQYGFALPKDVWGTFIWETYLAINNGIPFTHVTFPMYDNEFKYWGEELLEVMQFTHDLIYKEKVMPPGVTGLDTNLVNNLLLDGKLAMRNGIAPDHYTLVQQWNADIAAGITTGEPSSVELVALPMPHKAGRPERVLPRTNPLWVMTQNPDKGKEHLEEVVRFARFLTGPVVSAALLQRGQVPARESVFKVRPTLALDENVLFMLDYYERAGLPWAPRHPAYRSVFEDQGVSIWTMWKEVYTNTKSPEEAYRYYISRIKKKWRDWIDSHPEDAEEWASSIVPSEATQFMADWEPTPVDGVDE